MPAFNFYTMRSSGIFLLFFLIAGSVILGSCARSMNPDIERGSDYKFREGFPEVRLSAIGFLDENDEPFINIAADIVYGSLIYKEQNGKQVSSVAVEVQILDQENTDNLIKTRRYDFPISSEDPDIVHSQELFTFQKQIDVEPGSYQVNLVVIDQVSGKQITRVSNTTIPDPGANVSMLTNVRMLARDVDSNLNRWRPITTYDVPGKIDSLKFVFQVTNNRTEEPLTIDAKLIEFEADTSIARSMYFTNYSPSDISYKGIDYDEAEIIRSNRRDLRQPGSVLIEFKFPQQDRGNYRFEVNTNEQNGESQFKARDFSVKSRNYPSIKSPEELARPLYYLMEKGEYEDLLAIEDPDSMKSEIDRFWLRNIKNKQKARDVIQMYYQRVEEANKQFSNFKEGWKTDMGMIYILFGPPWYIDRRLDIMQWSYAYNRNDPEYNFVFRQTKLKTEFYPFDNYLLQRNRNYYQVQYQQIQLWLSGRILTRSI